MSFAAGVLTCAVWRAGLIDSLADAFVVNVGRGEAPLQTPQIWIGLLLIVGVSVSAGFFVGRAGARRSFWILGVGFMFSCFNMKPAAATILALSFLFLNLVMEGIPSFEPYREWFLTYHLGAWRFVFAKPIPWPRILESLCILVAFNLTAFLIGAAAFHARDIKS